jgi:hypothetical protein
MRSLFSVRLLKIGDLTDLMVNVVKSTAALSLSKAPHCNVSVFAPGESIPEVCAAQGYLEPRTRLLQLLYLESSHLSRLIYRKWVIYLLRASNRRYFAVFFGIVHP